MKGWRGKGADGKIYFRRNKTILRELLDDIKFRTKEEGRQIFSENQRADAITAFGILPKGWSLTRAVQALVDHLAKTRQVLGVSEAVRQFLATKARRSDMHVQDWTRKLNRWKATFEPTRTLDSVTTEEIEVYLNAYQGTTRNNQRAALLALFNWAVRVGAAPTNPVDKTDRETVVLGKPAILLPDEMAKLLHLAHSQGSYDVLTYLCLGGLCGLRPWECLRFQFGGLQLEHSSMRIEPEWTKVRRARVIQLNATAVEWLKLIPHGNPTDTMMPAYTTWVNRWKTWRKAENAPLPWKWWKGKPDVLRTTAATMMQAMPPRSLSWTAEQLGTSVQYIRKNYDQVVSQQVAERYWEICLPKKGVVSAFLDEPC